MKKLVFICRGNMFRSQLAAAIFNSAPLPEWDAVSYGVSVRDEGLQGVVLSQYGRGVQFEIEEMKKLGVDISNHTCNQLLPEYLEGVDKVVVMSEVGYTPKWLSERGYERWEVENPVEITADIAKNTVSLLTEKIEQLKNSLIA